MTTSLTTAPKPRKTLIVGGLCLVAAGSAGLFGYTVSKTTNHEMSIQRFSAKNAFDAVKTQTDFGPRIPETEGHKKSGDWLVSQLKSAGWEVTEQKGEIEHPLWKRKVPIRNIIASLNKGDAARVLLAAHWDTRPFAENDPISPKLPILGANDGASGVGILLELARVFKKDPPGVGVDIILWDFEDTGEPRALESYCLGSQYWSQHPHVPDYHAIFGMNLDMVGGFGAEFPREQESEQIGGFVYDHLEDAAEKLGFAKYFPNRSVGRIVDDHVYPIRNRQIPMVDLIHVDRANQFPSSWHTLQDKIDVISIETLEAVGKVIASVVYSAPALVK